MSWGDGCTACREFEASQAGQATIAEIEQVRGDDRAGGKQTRTR